MPQILFPALFLLLIHLNILSSDIVQKHVLHNGLTVLIKEKHNLPKVAIQVLYGVGSKHELPEEKGIAHLLEHMIFKGTHKLSETDHGAVVRKLSGHCNAYTSSDHTRFIYNLPSHNWKQIMPVIADCMMNCVFDDDVLNAEMKVVVQELKMYNDNYSSTLKEELQKTVFPEGHPYHDPIIGYKDNLRKVTGKDLYAFYKKYYGPNNATIIVVGDIVSLEVIGCIEKHFANISASKIIKQENFCLSKPIAKSITLYRDVKHPSFVYSFIIPGFKQKKYMQMEILEWIIGQGRGSRLYKKLVNDREIATNVSVVNWNALFEEGLFFINITPTTEQVKETIEELVCLELEDIARHGICDKEYARALKKMQIHNFELLETFAEQARWIGLTYLATKDENYASAVFQQIPNTLKQQLQDMVKHYFMPSVMYKGYLMPFVSQAEKNNWLHQQEESDKKDREEILSNRIRLSEVAQQKYAKKIKVNQLNPFAFPKAETIMLSNGLKVLYHHRDTPLLSMNLHLKAHSFYDPKEGLYKFVTEMMRKGTEKYTEEELIDALDEHGTVLEIFPGMISLRMLAEDLPIGLNFLKEMVTKCTFPEGKMNKVRNNMAVDLKLISDSPIACGNIELRKIIYKGHPYSKQSSGTHESLETISRKDLMDFYKKYSSPSGACLSIVGNLAQWDLQELVTQKLQDWVGPEIEDIEYPPLSLASAKEINLTMNRDQIFLGFAQLSIPRSHPHFDAYRIFDYILSGGSLGSIGSRLFDIRQRTGLFYAAEGSLVNYSGEQPGIFQIGAIVSKDNIEQAETEIKKLIDTILDTITQEEFEVAKRALINVYVNGFVSNDNIAKNFLFLERFKFSPDYFDNRAAELEKITIEDMKNAIRTILDSKKMVAVRVGRV